MIACHLVATGPKVKDVEAFVERLQRDLMMMGYKPGRTPLVEYRQVTGQYMAVVGEIVRKDGLT